MTHLLAILALAVAAVLFGVLYRHRGCGRCGEGGDAPRGECGGCPRARGSRETFDA